MHVSGSLNRRRQLNFRIGFLLRTLLWGYYSGGAHACTKWQMGGAGFTSALNNLYLAYPIFGEANGTFYIDSRCQASWDCLT